MRQNILPKIILLNPTSLVFQIFCSFLLNPSPQTHTIPFSFSSNIFWIPFPLSLLIPSPFPSPFPSIYLLHSFPPFPPYIFSISFPLSFLISSPFPSPFPPLYIFSIPFPPFPSFPLCKYFLLFPYQKQVYPVHYILFILLVHILFKTFMQYLYFLRGFIFAMREVYSCANCQKVLWNKVLNFETKKVLW